MIAAISLLVLLLCLAVVRLAMQVKQLTECAHLLAEAGENHLEAFVALCRALDGMAVLSGADEGKMRFTKLDIAFGREEPQSQTWRFSKN